ncbi:MAG: addiction module protein [Thermodesulfobacteriota bacterium]|nr:addiction module protein [Thermodesulfobacteriota bacterium]
MKSLDHILHEAANLPENQRSSLDKKPGKGVEQAWGELAEKRFSDLITGKEKPVSWDELKKEIQK